jgi:tetratricopeptide (TPR) repeat protein|tara:strand:+ start:624 stop:1304 length:681 start_codon:yes stop_codon:yes gene_type:complete
MRSEMNINKFLYTLILIFQLVILSNCQDANRFYDKGESLLQEGKNKKAVEYFNKSLKQNYKLPESYISRATAYIELGKYSLAEKDLNKVINGSYDQELKDSANYVMFISFAKQKKRAKAFEYLGKSYTSSAKSFKDKYSNLAQGYIELYGTSLLKEKRLEEAYRVFLKGVEYFPEDYSNYTSLAYIEEKHFSNSNKALQFLRKAKKLSNGKIKQDPNIMLERIKKM